MGRIVSCLVCDLGMGEGIVLWVLKVSIDFEELRIKWVVLGVSSVFFFFISYFEILEFWFLNLVLFFGYIVLFF